jgi:outer membrane protein assembly factor BamB
VVNSSLCAAEPWTTYRGNPERTGCTDGKPGPDGPKVLWAFQSKDHFIASPLPAGDKLIVSGIGNFANVPTFACLSTDPRATERTLWSKTTPAIKLPTVSTPAILDGKLIFGEGMHQTDGAILHCLSLDKGAAQWQLPLEGTLVHLEGSPTVAGGKVFLGGGAAGVLCVDPGKLTLGGKEMTPDEIKAAIARKWAELQKKYEEDLKKDPDFAVKPTEDMLPRPAPVLAWQAGKDKWHVDAPVAVVGDKVLVGTAFLDKEQVGERAVYCLSAKDGSEVWKAPVPLNPWGGPSVSGEFVVVSGSSIAYDPKAIKGAKGSVTCLGLADGKEKWSKEVPGGVESCVALAGGLAIASATDGKVRAYDLKTGEPKWTYTAKAPFFAPAAVAGDVVYAADTAGVLHAVTLAGGEFKWKLDLGGADVKAPGMVYGGPVVEGGRLYVATCNLEGPFAGKGTVVVCVGEK